MFMQYTYLFDLDLSRSTKVKSNVVVGLPIYGILLVFNDRVSLSSTLLRTKVFRFWVTLNYNFQRHSIKVKCCRAILLPSSHKRFLLLFNINIWPNAALIQNIFEIWVTLTLSLLVYNANIWSNSDSLRDRSLKDMSDLSLNLSMLLKVRFDTEVGLPIYDLLLVSNQ